MGDGLPGGFAPEELRGNRGLDHLVVLDQVRKGKRVELLVLDRQANVTGNLWVDRPYSHVYVTHGVTKERAEDIVEESRSIGLADLTSRKIGERYFLKAFLTEPSQRDRLAEEFVTDGLAIRAPRTHPYPKGSEHLEATIERLLEHGFTEQDRIRRRENAFRRVRRLRGEVSLEMSPMSDPEFAAFAALVRADPVLRDEFQTYAYQSEPLKPKDAKAAFHEAKQILNGDRWFRHDFRVIPTTRGGGNKYLLRAYSALYPGVGEPNILEAFAMDLPSGARLDGLVALPKPKCWSAYRDTAQQAEQRRFLEIAYPAMHTPSGRKLAAQDLREVLAMLPRHILRMDTETEDYLKHPDAPRPSGRIWSIPLGSTDERRLLVAKHRAPSFTEYDGAVVEVCEDALDLIRRANEYAKPFAFIAIHNATDFDVPALRIFNNPMSDRRREEWARRVIAESKHAADPVFQEAVHADTKASQAMVRELRKKHRPRGRVFTHPRPLDSLTELEKGPRVLTGLGLVALSTPKDRTYGQMEEGSDPDEDAIYTINDEVKQRKANNLVLPAMVALSAGSGAGLHRVALAQDYHHMTNRRKNDVLAKGKHLNSHVHTRKQDEAIEDGDKDAVKHFRVTANKGKTHLGNAGIWYNPTIPFAFRTELQRVDDLVRMFELAKDQHPYARIRALHAAEHYVASYLRHLKSALDNHRFAQKEPYYPLSRQRFTELMDRVHGESWPDMRLAKEHGFDPEFTLEHAYAWLRRTNKDLTETAARNGVVAVGPFLIGDLPQRYHSYFLGRGDVAVFHGGKPVRDRMLAVLDDADGDPYLLAHNVYIPKDDQLARPDIIRALRGEDALRWTPVHPRTQKLYSQLAGIGVPGAVGEQLNLL